MTSPAQVITGAESSFTVIFVVQVVKLPASSVAVIVMVVMPKPIDVPGNGDCVIATDKSQLSVAVTSVVRSGIRAVQLASALRVLSLAQTVIIGSETSLTVMFAVQVLILPASSVAVRVTVVTPNPTDVPDTGDCVIVTDKSQLSVAVTSVVRSGIRAVQLAPALRVLSPAHTVITGSVSSVTVTSAVHVAKLPASSVAVRVTVVTPKPITVPARGFCVIARVASQLSVAVTSPVRSGTVD
jgi:hypothetical protein